MIFFAGSKIFWGVFAPSHLLLWSVVIAAVLLVAGFRRVGQMLAVISAICFVIMGVLPTNLFLLRPIEYKIAQRKMPMHVDGILTLGGGPPVRLLKTYELARRYPAARVVFSGGSGNLFDNMPGREAQAAKQHLIDLGLNPKRLILENRSRNTWENISFTKQLIQPKADESWVLSTSALQMPRAMEIAKRLNWKLEPWATDYISQRQGFYGYFDIPDNLGAFDSAVREWIALYVYRWNGMAAAIKNPH